MLNNNCWASITDFILTLGWDPPDETIFNNSPKYWRISKQEAADTHLEHPKTSLDSLLDTSTAGAVDSMSAVDLSGHW